MSFDLIIQARFNSSRLRGKVFLNIGENMNSLDMLVKTAKKIRKIRKIILAVPNDKFSNIFKDFANKKKIYYFKSKKISEFDVLKRFFFASKYFDSKNIIRITSDCPFINSKIIELMIKKFIEENLEFLTNNKPRFVPHGFDCEIFSQKMLKQIYYNAKKKYQKEHVTAWFYDNLFNQNNNYTLFKKNFSKLRLTLDTAEDYISFVLNFKKYYEISQSTNPEVSIKKLYEKRKK